MQHSIKHESGQAAFSPPEESEGYCSCSLSRNHLGGDVPVSISQPSQPKASKPDDHSDEAEIGPHAGRSPGPPIQQPIQNDGNNEGKSDTLEYASNPEGVTDSGFR